jgi:hypothetical protein
MNTNKLLNGVSIVIGTVIGFAIVTWQSIPYLFSNELKTLEVPIGVWIS